MKGACTESLHAPGRDERSNGAETTRVAGAANSIAAAVAIAIAPGCLIGTAALADVLVIDGNPAMDIDLIAGPERTMVVMMQDGKTSKNLETAG